VSYHRHILRTKGLSQRRKNALRRNHSTLNGIRRHHPVGAPYRIHDSRYHTLWVDESPKRQTTIRHRAPVVSGHRVYVLLSPRHPIKATGYPDIPSFEADKTTEPRCRAQNRAHHHRTRHHPPRSARYVTGTDCELRHPIHSQPNKHRKPFSVRARPYQVRGSTTDLRRSPPECRRSYPHTSTPASRHTIYPHILGRLTIPPTVARAPARRNYVSIFFCSQPRSPQTGICALRPRPFRPRIGAG
jgi:hypothetical protein